MKAPAICRRSFPSVVVASSAASPSHVPSSELANLHTTSYSITAPCGHAYRLFAHSPSFLVATSENLWHRGTINAGNDGLGALRAPYIRKAILSSRDLQPPSTMGGHASYNMAWEDQILNKANYSLIKMRQMMSSKMRNGGGRLYVGNYFSLFDHLLMLALGLVGSWARIMTIKCSQ